MKLDLTLLLKRNPYHDGSIWRDVLGPELAEFLITQAWDDICKGLHRDLPPQYRDDHGRYGEKNKPTGITSGPTDRLEGLTSSQPR